MSLVILEGVDGSGKTTLARSIAGRYKVPVFHDGPPDDPDYAFSELVRDLNGAQMKCVWDRFHFGNQVYGTVFRGSPDLSPYELELFEDMLLERGAVLVLCKPPIPLIQGVIENRRELDGFDAEYEDSWEKTSQVIEGMDLMYSITKLPKVLYDYTNSLALRKVYTVIERELEWVVS